MHGRLPWLTPDDLSSPQRAVYQAITGGPRSNGAPAFQLLDEAGRLEGPFNAMLLSPGVGQSLQALGAAVRYQTDLPDRCREISILTVAAARRSEFEWYAHERVGRSCGLTDDELQALRQLRPADSFSPVEVVTHQTVLALVRCADLDDDEFSRAKQALGLVQLTELVMLVGYYTLLALSLTVFRTPLPSGEASAL